MLFLNELEDNNCRMSVLGVNEMVFLFRKMNYLISYGHILDEDNMYERIDVLFYQFMMKNLIHNDSKKIRIFQYLHFLI